MYTGWNNWIYCFKGALIEVFLMVKHAFLKKFWIGSGLYTESEYKKAVPKKGESMWGGKK